MSTALEPRTRVTPQELLGHPDAILYELVDGDLVERHMSAMSSLVGMKIGRKLGEHCDPLDLAWIFGADQGYRCFPDDPDRVRKPDVSLVLRERLPAEQLEVGFVSIPPDLAVEVVSPNDLAVEVERKVLEYLSAGVSLVWVAYPSARTIHVFRADGSSAVLRESDTLDARGLLPGFSVPVANLFPVLKTPS